MSIDTVISKMASTNIFERNGQRDLQTGLFIGRPFYLDYENTSVLVADAWKQRANGIPQGAFLLAYYDNEQEIEEAMLLRVLHPARLPTDNDIIASMVEYYKDNLRTSGRANQLDTFTRYEFSFSGLECRVLGTFYQTEEGQTLFGADVENFYSAHNYQVLKPSKAILELIVNYRENGVTGQTNDIKIGQVRYSSSQRFQLQEDSVPVYVSPQDFLGKRTALFGMTRTGKSNTVKKIIQATVRMSDLAPMVLSDASRQKRADNLAPLTDGGLPKFAVGQIIFDINGEYANANLQDEGTAIFDLYQEKTQRYSVLPKTGFNVMKVNFYRDIIAGLELVRSHLALDGADYVKSFLSIDLVDPAKDNADAVDYSSKTRFERKKAAYLCCLYQAGFKAPANFTVSFSGNEEINKFARADGSLDPSTGISLEDATHWFLAVWNNYEDEFFTKYKKKKGHEWADEDLKALMVFLSRKSKSGGSVNNSGYLKIRNLAELHTDTAGKPFDKEIIEELRLGRIIIVDLSQGDPEIQRLYSERICRQIFADAMSRFIDNKPNNFIQFYFEEAHNLFPKKEDRDLSQIYNRIAKEGAKLNLGLIYATQEVSSISSNILKNTQNWFIAHLNNEDETREIKKYYDFGDFSNSLVRFSAETDKGFVRMKTYSNPFVVPVQIDRFMSKEQ